MSTFINEALLQERLGEPPAWLKLNEPVVVVRVRGKREERDGGRGRDREEGGKSRRLPAAAAGRGGALAPLRLRGRRVREGMRSGKAQSRTRPPRANPGAPCDGG